MTRSVTGGVSIVAIRLTLVEGGGRFEIFGTLRRVGTPDTRSLGRNPAVASGTWQTEGWADPLRRGHARPPTPIQSRAPAPGPRCARRGRDLWSRVQIYVQPQWNARTSKCGNRGFGARRRWGSAEHLRSCAVLPWFGTRELLGGESSVRVARLHGVGDVRVADELRPSPGAGIRSLLETGGFRPLTHSLL